MRLIRGSPRKRLVRCYYWRDSEPLGNLGDFLVPALLDAFGYACAPRDTPDSEVVNPGRCLLVIGSLLTPRDVERIGCPLDVWGTGWKGQALAPGKHDLRYFAVRGPQTAAGLGLPPHLPLGDPALLLPRMVPVRVIPSGRTLVIPHFSRLAAMHARRRAMATGCDEVLSPLVLRPGLRTRLSGFRWSDHAGLVHRRLRCGIRTRGLWEAVGRLAGAAFVLSGSLHGAILAQAFGVPWACYDDGYVDAPAKWTDWAAYLGIDLAAVRTLEEGRRWWTRVGHKGRVRDLGPLAEAFPYRA